MPNLDPITGFPIPVDYGNDGLDKFTAGMALANPISGWSDRRFAPNYKADVPEEKKADYDPWADRRIDKYDPMHFVDSQSEAETTNMIDAIERNMKLQQRGTGVAGIAGTVTGVFSNPLIMLPAIATSGSSIPAMMAAEVGGEMLSEKLLHSQQPLRTKTESALNIGFAGVAAGLGGMLQKRLGRSAQREAVDTAHGGDGMYAHPIPDEARTGYVQPSREFVEGAPIGGVRMPHQDEMPIPNLQDMARDPEYWATKKGKVFREGVMTPDEYIEATAKGFDRSTDEMLADMDKALIDEYAEAMTKGDKFPKLFLDYSDEFGQEGRHRAFAAKQAGFDEVPVVVIERTADKGKMLPDLKGLKAGEEAIEETLSVATKELNVASSVLKKANAAAVKARALVKEMGC